MSLRIYGNRLLKTLPNQNTRPTSARVRQAVFNIWQGTITGCRWLDLCAGSGSMGAEALCRGASVVIGIEEYSRACEVIEENWQKVANNDQQFQILRGNITQQINKLIGQKFDRIYFDPPYASGLYVPILQAIAENELLDIEGEIGVEHSHQNWTAPEIVNLEICRQKYYGNTGITFYQRVRRVRSAECGVGSQE